MNELAAATTKRMKLRYAGVCRSCGGEIPAGVIAVYDKVAKNVTCAGCTHEAPVAPVPVGAAAPVVPEPEPVDAAEVVVGVAGASARREYERRKINDERHVAEWKERVHSKHPVLGGLMLAVADEPKNSGTRAWDVGAHGEEVFAASLDRLADAGLYFLHDRRIPPTRANIDHIVIAPTGVYVIDAKNYTGRAQLRVTGGIFSPRVEKLMVGRRDCTKLVDSVHKQVDRVSELLARDGIGQDVPVHGMLCFVEGDWPVLGGSFTIGGLDVLWPKKARKIITAPGPLGDDRLRVLHRHLTGEFPPA
ncbi:MAG TPA: nuclease-related domain-containing protein [Nocardioidaceae bacterium]|nr:nuclease-related domain-containing protein [Nocardioidaceae bacterium]